MSKVLTNKSILEHIQKIITSKRPTILAVSYWGQGAVRKLEISKNIENIKIVLNVHHGGTNPKELKELMKALPNRVRIHHNLHAKIYASHNQAIVGSANASRYGLNWLENGNSEAAIYLEKGASEAFKLAKKFYDEGEPAQEEHVEICQKRFKNTSLAKSVEPTRETSQNKNALDTFLSRQDIFGDLPIVISKGKAARDKYDRDLKRLGGKLTGLTKEKTLDHSTMSYFDYALHERYKDKVCLEIHKAKNGEFSFHLIRPTHFIDGGGTFAERLKFSEIGELGPYWNGKNRSIQPIENIKKIHKSLHKRDFVVGHDVFNTFKQLPTP